MPTLHAHAAGAAGGSELYRLSPEHLAGVLALVMLLSVAWLVRGSRLPRLSPVNWLLVALLAASAAVHAGLAVGHSEHGVGLQVLMALDAIALAFVARRVRRGASAGRLGLLVLGGSVVAYWISAAGGEPPDQLGLATKLGEILAERPEFGSISCAVEQLDFDNVAGSNLAGRHLGRPPSRN